MDKNCISETDLYEPIYEFLTEQGYEVHSEVNDCDVTAVKDDEIIIVELKCKFSTKLLVQATKRQKITDFVYVALPIPDKGYRSKNWLGIRHLLRRLELGLIFVSFAKHKPLHTRSQVEPGKAPQPLSQVVLGKEKAEIQIVFHPLPFERKKKPKDKRALLKEISERSGDYNKGGSSKTKLITAYKEKAIHIACCLKTHGKLSPKELRKLGTDNKTQSILSNNYYNWFERINRGIYALKQKAKEELKQFPDIIQHYESILEKSA